MDAMCAVVAGKCPMLLSVKLRLLIFKGDPSLMQCMLLLDPGNARQKAWEKEKLNTNCLF